MITLYFILFVFIDVMFYLKFNKAHVISGRSYLYFLISLGLVCLIHIGIFKNSGLMQPEYFFKVLALSGAALVIHFWFNKIVVRRVTNLNGPSEGGKSAALKVFAVLFTIVMPIIIFFAQCSSIMYWQQHYNK